MSVSLKEYVEKLIAAQDEKTRLALAALNKNRSDMISYLALVISLAALAYEVFKK